MTANEMAGNIEVHLNLNHAGFSYEDPELSVFLTTAQNIYTKEFIDKFNAKRESFEETEVRGWGFGPLIQPATLVISTDQTGAFTNGTYYNLPIDLWQIISDTPTSNKHLCNENSKPFIKPRVEVTSHDEYNRSIRNIYKKPYIDVNDGKVWRMYDNSRRVQLLTDGTFTITEYKIKYLRNLPNIVVNRDTPLLQTNCILEAASKEVHETIVEIAIRLIDKSINLQRMPSGIEQLN